MAHDKGLDNVAVQWPRTGRFYEPVALAEFVDFGGLAERIPEASGPAVALADPGCRDRHACGLPRSPRSST